MTSSDGLVWWAIIAAVGDQPPTTPLEQVDLNSIDPPNPGWAVLTPGGWRVEVKPAMDEPAWRFYLEEWAAGRA